MPLKLNIGLARKVGETNYGSRGASVNVEMELESALVSEPAKLKDRIRQLFDVVRSSLTEELNGNSNGHANTDHAPSNGHTPSNGQAPSNGQTNNGHKPARMATLSQVKALYAITKNRGMDLSLLLRERFHVARPEDLSIKDASSLIGEMNGKD